MKKPKHCEDCPVVRRIKGAIVCGCMKDLTATTEEDKKTMWASCPIGWDK